MNTYSIYGNMNKNIIFYALNYIKNHIIIRISYMLSVSDYGLTIDHTLSHS